MATIVETSSEPLWPADVLELFGQEDPAPEAPPPVEWAVDPRDPWIGARVFALSADFDASRPQPSLRRFHRTANVVKRTVHGYALSCGRIAQEHHLLTLREARAEAVAGVEDAPRESSEFLFLGEMLLEDGYLHVAEQAFARAVQLAQGRPLDQAECRVRRGQALTLCGWFDKALDEFHEALRSDPSCAGAFLARGDGWMEWGEYETAMCDYYEAHLLRLYDPEPLVRRGRANCARGDFRSAEVDLREALRIASGSLHAQLGLTWALLGQGKLDEASSVCETLIADAPTWRSPRLAKSEILFRQGRLGEAEQESRAAGALVPSEAKAAADPWIDRAQTAMAKGDHAAALRFHTIAVQVAPGCEAPRAALYSARQANDWQAALLFESTRGPLFEPRSALEYVRRGDALRHAPGGDALREYTEAIRLDPTCAAAHAHRGALLLDEGDLDGAALDLARALRLHPKFHFALAERGRLRRLQGDDDAAAADMDESRKTASENSLRYFDSCDRRSPLRSLHMLSCAWPPSRPERTAACGRRRLGMRPGRIAPDAALERVEDDVRCSPGAASSFARGAVRHARGDFKGAVEDYLEASLDPAWRVAAQSGVGQSELEDPGHGGAAHGIRLDVALSIDPNHVPSLFHRSGKRLKEAVRFNRRAGFLRYGLEADPRAAADAARARDEACALALVDLDRAIRLGPSTAGMHLRRGLVRWIGSDLEGALTDFEEAVRRDPSNDAARWRRGCAYAEAGYLRSALVDLQPPFQDERLSSARRMVRGEVRQAVGDFVGAAADFDGCFGSPGGADARRCLGLAQRDGGDLVQAERTLSQAIDEAERDWEEIGAWCDRGLLRLALDRPAEALADFNRMLELLPKHAASFEGRARCKRLLGDDDGALADFDQALRSDPRSATAFHGRGRLWKDRQAWDKALRDFSDALRLDPLLAAALVDRGLVWISKQEHYAAIRDFTEALRLDSGSAIVQEHLDAARRALAGSGGLDAPKGVLW